MLSLPAPPLLVTDAQLLAHILHALGMFHGMSVAGNCTCECSHLQFELGPSEVSSNMEEWILILPAVYEATCWHALGVRQAHTKFL